MIMRFRTIAFDLDGTLVDTLPDLAQALNHTLCSIGRRTLADMEVRDLIGHGTRAMLRAGLAATGDSDQPLVDDCYPILMRHYEAHLCDLSTPYPGVEQALDLLTRGGAKLAICTNKPEQTSRDLVNALGWRDRFSVIVGGDTLPVTKPDPKPLWHAVALAGGDPAVFVGGSIVDIRTARAASLPCVAVSHGYSDRPIDTFGADAMIDRFDALIAALEHL